MFILRFYPLGIVVAAADVMSSVSATEGDSGQQLNKSDSRGREAWHGMGRHSGSAVDGLRDTRDTT